MSTDTYELESMKSVGAGKPHFFHLQVSILYLFQTEASIILCGDKEEIEENPGPSSVYKTSSKMINSHMFVLG